MISIIVPTYNEKEVIEDFLKEIEKVRIPKEIIVVDDSSDETASLTEFWMKKLKIRGKIIKRRKRLGKGSAIKSGMKYANGSIIILIDADLQYPPSVIPSMIKLLKNFDIVTVDRIRKEHILRQLPGRFFRILTKTLFGMNFDTQGGLKVMKNYIKKINFDSKGWIWDVEFLWKIKKLGYSIGSYPVKFEPRKKGKSKITLFVPLEMLLDVLKLFLKIRFS